MLTRMQIENFKSWKKANVEFAPLTAFFGANSSGKSSLIQFLLLLKQTKDSPDRAVALDFGGPESLADLGSFVDAVHARREDASIDWRLDWRMRDELQIADPSGKRSEALFRGHEIGIASSAKLRNKNVVNDFLVYDFSNVRFSLDRASGEGSSFKLEAKPSNGFRFTRTPGRKWDLPGPTKSYAFPDQARTYFQNSQFLSDFEVAYVTQMDGILHLGPLRDYPKRQYVWAGSSPVDVGRRGERTIEAVLAATARGLRRNFRRKSRLRPFQEIIALWLKEMRLIEQFRVEEVKEGAGLFRVHVRRDSRASDVLITDVGFGVSQILPVLVLLYYAPEGATVILEQPEIHLHPAVQSALADLITTAIKTRNIQVILESHSEHILQRLLRRIAEGENSPYPAIGREDVKLYFCQATDGASRLQHLDVNLFGTIANWPEDFFGDPFGEVAARDEAAMVRRNAGA